MWKRAVRCGLVAVLALPGLSVVAAEDPAQAYWTASQLSDRDKTLGAKLNDRKLAVESLGKFGQHAALLVHREATDEVEWHELTGHLVVIQSGDATAEFGGELVDPRTTAPHEMRADAIRNGVTRKVAAGDIVYFPAKTPHHFIMEPGQHVTYFMLSDSTP